MPTCNIVILKFDRSLCDLMQEIFVKTQRIPWNDEIFGFYGLHENYFESFFPILDNLKKLNVLSDYKHYYARNFFKSADECLSEEIR